MTLSHTDLVPVLIYIDGVRVNVLDDFNTEDIESVEVIKGPAAATLYGEEASAGVIRISLKEARP